MMRVETLAALETSTQLSILSSLLMIIAGILAIMVVYDYSKVEVLLQEIDNTTDDSSITSEGSFS